MAERDKIDGEIEGCVASLLERLRAVEADNEVLRGRLAAAGLPDEGNGGAGEAADSPARAGRPGKGARAEAHNRGSTADVLVVR